MSTGGGDGITKGQETKLWSTYGVGTIWKQGGVGFDNGAARGTFPLRRINISSTREGAYW